MCVITINKENQEVKRKKRGRVQVQGYYWVDSDDDDECPYVLVLYVERLMSVVGGVDGTKLLPFAVRLFLVTIALVDNQSGSVVFQNDDALT